MLDRMARVVQSQRAKQMTHRLLMKAAQTDLPMPYQQPVLYLGTRPAAFLFLQEFVLVAVARLSV